MDDDGSLGIIALAGMLIVAALVVAISFGPALSHSWYPFECCGDNDCAPIEASRVKVTQGGYLVDGKFLVPADKARISQDSDYHACFWPNPDVLHCFFVPPMGS